MRIVVVIALEFFGVAFEYSCSSCDSPVAIWRVL